MSFIFPSIATPAPLLEPQAGVPEIPPSPPPGNVATGEAAFGGLDGLLATEVEIFALASVFALLAELQQRQPEQPNWAAAGMPNVAGAGMNGAPNAASAPMQAGAANPGGTVPPSRQLAAAPTQATALPTNIRYRSEIMTAARRHNISPVVLAAVAAQETGGPSSNSGANIVGADGTGHGVFQIDSGTWSTWLQSHDNGMNVAQNADKAAAILADNLQRTGGDVRRALHLYNAGSESRVSTTTTWPDGQTLSYEDSVLRHVARLQG